MAEITLSAPHGYKATINTEIMDVEIKKTYLGVGFETEYGEKLSVSMRDSGYELKYTDERGGSIRIELQDGVYRVNPNS